MSIRSVINQMVVGLTALNFPNCTWHNSLQQASNDRWGSVTIAEGVSEMVMPYTLAIGVIVYFNALTQDEFDHVQRYLVRGSYAPHRQVKLRRADFRQGGGTGADLEDAKFDGYFTLFVWSSGPPEVVGDMTPATDLQVVFRDADQGEEFQTLNIMAPPENGG